ncbi:hypothetical protein PGH26_03070 [Sporosarcina jeotgali]|uniref:Uncharacterized protein n=1 Tax=Sporosarcina jeotgali TaxID=3020056 RepID=A0ABZ0KWZ2_9BACL|nr:hypothetical protein [Sporosarcina sp. B2O-1]WOV84922.1 hypothetical protein PGH26_03070 [Sporosarcina sp. B2O-1]
MEEIKIVFQVYRAIHIFVTGFIVILFSGFLAVGGLGENFTDSVFTAPLWLLPIPVWLIGAVLSFVKRTVKIGLVISALPFLFFIVSIVEAIYS